MILIGFVTVGATGIAHAQQPTDTVATFVSKPAAGECHVVISLDPPPPKDSFVQLAINKNPLPAKDVSGLRQYRLKLIGPLAEGDQVRLRMARSPGPPEVWGEEVEVVGSAAKPECTAKASDDGREAFVASAYVGYAFDNFAPAAAGGYTPQESSPPKRFITGANAEFRLIGASDKPRQLWLFGEALYGVRSADVNCSSSDKPAVCNNLPKDVPQQSLFILEHASSLEAFLGVRYELLTLQANSAFPTKFYVTGQFGVVMVNGEVTPTSQENGTSFTVRRGFSAPLLGGGLLAPSGNYSGTYIEVAWGKSDLYRDADGNSHWNRLKIDANISFPMGIPFTKKLWGSGPRVFVQFFNDFDPTHKASDAMQTFIGLDFDIREVFKW